MPETAKKSVLRQIFYLQKKFYVIIFIIKDISLRIIKFLVKRELLINMFSYSQTSTFYVKGNFKLDSIKEKISKVE